MISYMDFECPYCSKLYPVLKQFVDESDSKVNLAIRLYPLAFHTHADSLANSAECVGEQMGNAGFFAFADKVFAAGRIEGSTDAFLAPILDTSDSTRKNMWSASSPEDLHLRSRLIWTKVPRWVFRNTFHSVSNSSTKKAKFVAGTKSLQELKEAAKSISE